ncbi:hypothetical protein KBZ94_38245 [Streptomyces sp. RM72]|nr:hypothetical protein [Streptomyces sp. RM72]MBQ0890695.1 hypothetical protein [Streptomyces sp. RM72]
MTSNFTSLPWPAPAPKSSTTADESAPALPEPAATAEPDPGGPDAATAPS